MKKIKVGVFGSEGDHCSDQAYEMAYQVGKELAKRNAIVFNGGTSGVMEAVSKGAKEQGAEVIGILPGDDASQANAYLDIAIPTGIGFARGQILTNTVDACIVIEGGLGTHQEVAFMYWLKKPCVAIASTGGTAQEVAGKSLDRRNLPPILSAESAVEAVETLIEALSNYR